VYSYSDTASGVNDNIAIIAGSVGGGVGVLLIIIIILAAVIVSMKRKRCWPYLLSIMFSILFVLKVHQIQFNIHKSLVNRIEMNEEKDHNIIEYIASAFILSRRDYCNSILAGLPKSTIATLQRVQNVAARVLSSYL